MNNCQLLNEKTLNSGTRVDDVALESPDCACEQQTMSQYSPGPVAGTENLSRFLFSMHVGTNGKVKPSAYSHVLTKGCSVQREDKANDNELKEFLNFFLNNNSQHEWVGCAQANCDQVRSLKLTGSNKRLFCVYDTAEETNPSHAEIFAARKLDDEGEAPEARALIKEAFNGDEYIKPDSYRNGSLQKKP